MGDKGVELIYSVQRHQKEFEKKKTDNERTGSDTEITVFMDISTNPYNANQVAKVFDPIIDGDVNKSNSKNLYKNYENQQ